MSSALYNAVNSGDTFYTIRLLKDGADVDYIDPVTSTTCLMTAAGKGDLEMCKVLLHYGAHPNIKWNGMSALDVAKMQNHSAIVKLLSK